MEKKFEASIRQYHICTDIYTRLKRQPFWDIFASYEWKCCEHLNVGHPCTRVCSDVSWPNCCFVYSATKSTLLFPWPPPGQALPNPLVGMLQRSTGGGGWHLPTKTEDQCNIFKMSPAWIFIVPDSVWIEVLTFLLFGRAVSLQAIRDTLAESRVHFADR